MARPGSTAGSSAIRARETEPRSRWILWSAHSHRLRSAVPATRVCFDAAQPVPFHFAVHASFADQPICPYIGARHNVARPCTGVRRHAAHPCVRPTPARQTRQTRVADARARPLTLRHPASLRPSPDSCPVVRRMRLTLTESGGRPASVATSCRKLTDDLSRNAASFPVDQACR
jgi:hypothetical protein